MIPIASDDDSMRTKQKKIDLSGVEIRGFEIKRERGDETTAEFAVEGVARGLDEETVEEVMVANEVIPESLTLTLKESSE